MQYLDENLKFWQNLLVRIKRRFVKIGKKNPYQDFNDEQNIIFIHIPKSAGVSIEETLFHQKVGHKTIREFEAYDSRKFNDYLKFTIVRNPYDRLVSAFHFLKKGGRNDIDKAWALKNLGELDDFASFLLKLNDETFSKKILKWQHFAPQYHYLVDSNDEVKIDFVLMFENLENDFARLADKLKLQNVKLKHENRSGRKDWVEYYDEPAKALVHKLYERDFNLFYE